MNITLSNPPSRAQRRFLTIEGVPASTPEESLYAQHPSGTPNGGPGQLKWLITEPTRDAPTSRWRSYRETCARLVERNPGNPLAVAFLEEAKRVLTWRAALPEQLHFWREDKHEPGTR